MFNKSVVLYLLFEYIGLYQSLRKTLQFYMYLGHKWGLDVVVFGLQSRDLDQDFWVCIVYIGGAFFCFLDSCIGGGWDANFLHVDYFLAYLHLWSTGEVRFPWWVLVGSTKKVLGSLLLETWFESRLHWPSCLICNNQKKKKKSRFHDLPLLLSRRCGFQSR